MRRKREGSHKIIEAEIAHRTLFSKGFFMDMEMTMEISELSKMLNASLVCASSDEEREQIIRQYHEDVRTVEARYNGKA